MLGYYIIFLEIEKIKRIKGIEFMIEITKQEENQLREILPTLYVARTSKKKKANRGKLYVEPTSKVISALKQIRNVSYIDR